MCRNLRKKHFTKTFAKTCVKTFAETAAAFASVHCVRPERSASQRCMVSYDERHDTGIRMKVVMNTAMMSVKMNVIDTTKV